ncbi:hypothetical protein SO802_014542 [Lithocarpus litseifolius]|uniref:Glycosyltransferase 61 catalytic domain-containing protein n=1 Tax=Lithocarpus litseifolius TaxID=425828 RepID=A0AAW2CRE2_9ROSI
MFGFKHFLRETCNLKIKNVSDIEKPKLLLISRPKIRKFINEDEMVDMMEELGFEVVVAMRNRMSNLDKFAEVLNSCSVMVGAHGGMVLELQTLCSCLLGQYWSKWCHWGWIGLQQLTLVGHQKRWGCII